MVHGSWFMVHGSWFMVHGSWFMVHGSRFKFKGLKVHQIALHIPQKKTSYQINLKVLPQVTGCES